MKSFSKAQVQIFTSCILLCFSFFYHNNALAENQQNLNEEALVNIKIGVELASLEQSAKDIANAIEEGSLALQKMSVHPNLSQEQQENIAKAFQSIDRLAVTFQESVKTLPKQISAATPPIENAMNNLFSNIQLAIIIAIICLIILLVAAFIAIYYWILKPTSTMLIKTTSKLDNMASALQITANIVEKSSDQQIKILQANKELLSTLKE